MSGFSEDLERLRQRIQGDATATDDDLLADLETAYEELRAADEEVRSQQEQIAALAQGYDLVRLQQERMLAILPVPVVLTEANGVIRWANAAAAGFLGTRPGRLVGKPAFSFVAPEDRRELRTALGEVAPHQGPVRRTVTMQPRAEQITRVEITMTHEAEQPRRVTWMLLYSEALQSRSDVDALPDALVKLAALPGTCSDAQQALSTAVPLVTAVLGMDVSISTGSPVAPDAIASSSPLAQAIDGAQVTAGEGPCATAFDTAMVVESEDLASDDRWLRLGRLVPSGTAAVAVPLLAGGAPLGTLNAYGRPAHLLGARVDACELIGSTIAAAVYEQRAKDELTALAADLERAMASRAVIEQAKGIVMGAKHCDAQAAFDHLVELSSTQHIKLREVAARIVAGALSPEHGG